MARKPSVSLVSSWDITHIGEGSTIMNGTAVFEDDYAKVINTKTKKVTYFYGETAWSDAQRLASDLDFKA